MQGCLRPNTRVSIAALFQLEMHAWRSAFMQHFPPFRDLVAIDTGKDVYSIRQNVGVIAM